MKKLLILLLFGWNTQAAITFDNVAPDPTTVTTTSVIDIIGFLTVDGGSAISAQSVFVNFGVLTVTGLGSSVALLDQIQAGDGALQRGNVSVLEGATLSSSFARFHGSEVGGLKSQLTVSGPGSSFIVAPTGYSTALSTFIFGDLKETAVQPSGSINNGGFLSIDGEADLRSGHLTVTDSGVISVTESLRIVGGESPPPILTIGPNGLVDIDKLTQIGTGGVINLAGGTLETGILFLQTELTGYGMAQSPRMNIFNGSTVTASGGILELGDETVFNPFEVFDANVIVENGATLKLNSFVNFSPAARVTELQGGTLDANTGVFLGSTNVITGDGSVSARLSAASGSTIYATGNLSLGDSSALDGFFSDGLLFTNNNTVTLNDANRAVVGSLTEIGNSTGPGTLSAPNGILVEFGKNISGYGTIIADILNNGFIQGVGPDVADFLDLQGLVTGVGDYGGTIAFSGGFSPGLSPTETNVENVIFTSNLEIEIGGLIPGSEFDLVTASGFAILGGTLQVTLIDSFVPEGGDTFVFLTAVGGITGDFSAFDFPIFDGLTFNLFVGDDFAQLTASAVPIPAAIWLFGSALGLLGWMRRKAT